MNIVRISAGLGNQMFQYALAFALEKQKKDSVKLDISEFAYRKHHQGYELERIFNITSSYATYDEVAKIADTCKSLSAWFRRDILKIKLHTQGTLYKESGFEYNPLLKDMHNTYFQGFWQSWKYFQDVEQELRNQFTFKTLLSPENTICANAMATCESVAIHVRRGDYTKPRRWKEIGSICSLDYYNWAIAHIREQLKENVHFFIFSDDMEWVKNNLPLENATYVSWNNGAESYNDMRLMSLCKHNIIANSSFSWWGAYLNANPDKIVIAPAKWYRSTPTPHLIPQGWIQLPID